MCQELSEMSANHRNNILTVRPSCLKNRVRILGVSRVNFIRPHESLADCARREVFEETGVHIRVLKVVMKRSAIPYLFGKVSHII
jgi:8-oxo-dGTP pyrophosphatase MutT (NUDIX family)